MIKMQITRRGRKPRNFNGDKFPISIGSGPDDSLSMPDAGLKPGHLNIERTDGGFRLSIPPEHLPLELNGSLTRAAYLCKGDTIAAGGYSVRISALSGMPSPAVRLTCLHNITRRLINFWRKPDVKKPIHIQAAQRTPWMLVSIILHLMFLLMASMLVVAVPPPEEPEAFFKMQTPVFKPGEYDPHLKRDMTACPKEIENEIKVEEALRIEEELLLDDLQVEALQEMPETVERAHHSTVMADTEGENWSKLFSVAGAQAGMFGWRSGGKRTALKRYGGSEATEAAVEAALQWLKRHQAPDGSWSMSTYQAECAVKPRCGFHNILDTDMAQAQLDMEEYPRWWDNCATGLALLCYLGAGHTHKAGPYRKEISAGLNYLRRAQASSGAFADKNYRHDRNYVHAIATMAVAEAYGMTRDVRLKGMTAKAVKVIRKSQNRYLGWDYADPSGRNDISVSGWQIMALKSAHTAGISIGDAFDGGRRLLSKLTPEVVRDPEPILTNHCAYTYYRDHISPGHRNATCTAISFLCRILMGDDVKSDTIKGHANLMMQYLPGDFPNGDLYQWYYGTMAMFQMGDDYWLKWNEALKDTLCASQVRDGCGDGSWNPTTDWSCQRGGRLFTTAMACLSLEVYYRYLPIIMDRNAAAAQAPYRPAPVNLKGRVSVTQFMRERRVSLVVGSDRYRVFDRAAAAELEQYSGRYVKAECLLVGRKGSRTIDEILQLEDATKAIKTSSQFQFPVKAYLKSMRLGGTFGFLVPASSDNPFAGNYHLAEDIWLPGGTPVYSIADGVVMYSDFSPSIMEDDGTVHWGLGNAMVIEHTLDPAEGKLAKVCSVYYHLAKDRRFKVGDTVKRGQLIAYIGADRSEENGMYTEHLHFGIHKGPYYQLNFKFIHYLVKQAIETGLPLLLAENDEIPEITFGAVTEVAYQSADRIKVTFQHGVTGRLADNLQRYRLKDAPPAFAPWNTGYGDKADLTTWMRPSVWIEMHMVD